MSRIEIARNPSDPDHVHAERQEEEVFYHYALLSELCHSLNGSRSASAECDAAQHQAHLNELRERTAAMLSGE